MPPFAFGTVLVYLVMIIKYDNPAGQLAGKVGGHYLQSSQVTPSLRTKRNGSNRKVWRNEKQRGLVGYLGRFWNTLSDAQKLTYYNNGVANPEFNSLDSSHPLFAYWVFIALNSRRVLFDVAPLASAAVFIGNASSSVTVTAATLVPITITGTKSIVPQVGRTGVFAQLNYGSETNPAIRNKIWCGWQVGSNTTLPNVTMALRNRYGNNTKPVSISLFAVNQASSFAYYSIGPVVQAFFTPAP